jgi:hypothetical protein
MMIEKKEKTTPTDVFGPRQWLLLILLWLLVIGISYPGMIAHFGTRIPKAHMDTTNHLAAINWQNHFLFHEPGLVLNLGTFYPHALATYFGPPMFGIAPWFGLFHLLGLNVYGQFNLFIVFTFLLGAAGVFLLALEVSGPEKTLAFVASAIYIAFNTQRSLFTWLPLFMSAFVPWTLLFFFRYLRSRRPRDLLFFLLFAAALFIVSAYLGVYLLAFYLPWLVLFALLFQALPLRNFLLIAAGLAVVAAIVLALHFPIITSYGGLTTFRAYHPSMLLNVSDIFTANRSFLYGQLLKMHRPAIYNWFPGIAASLFFFLSGFSPDRSRRWPWIAFIVAAIVAVLLLKDSHMAWASLIYFALLALLASGHIRQRRRHLPVTLMALGFVGYMLFFFNFRSMGLPGQLIPYSHLAAIVPYFQRMCEYKRVFIILVPVMAVLAAHALRGWPRQHRWLPFLALGLIWLENFEPAIGNWGKSMPWDKRAPIYAVIPRQSDKVILELPFFGGKNIWSLASYFQSIYAYSTRFHWNYVVNGRDSFAPLDHQELARRATIPEVLTTESIEWLKRGYSVDYLVINWPFLNQEEAARVKERLPVLEAAGEKVLEIPEATVFRLLEKGEVTELARTYSAYHLRHRQLQVRFREPCTLRARVDVSGRFWREFQLRNSPSLTFRVAPDRVGHDCEMVVISFSRPVKVEEISLSRSSANAGSDP